MKAFSATLLRAAACFALLVALTGTARADAFTWFGIGNSNNWVDDTGNWISSSPYPYPGYISLIQTDTAEFGMAGTQSFTTITQGQIVVASLIYTSGGFTLTNIGSFIVTNGNVATYDTAPNLQNLGSLYFSGTMTVRNLTGTFSTIQSYGGSATLSVLGSGTYAGALASSLGTMGLTVGDGTHSALLNLNPTENPNDYTGLTRVNAHATLVSGRTNALSASSAHVIDGTLSLASGSAAVASLSGMGTVSLDANTLTIGSGGVFDGRITGPGGSLVKSGTGTLSLSGSHSYTGNTTVSGGKLAVNGSLAGGATVQDGATLLGSGTIGGSVLLQAGGTLAPGNSPGQLTLLDDLSMDEQAFLLLEFSGTGASLYDQLAVEGDFAAGGTLSLQILDGYTPAEGDTFTVFNGSTPGYDSGSFTLETNLGGGLFWDTSQLATSGILTVVPEPSIAALLMLSSGGIAILRRRRSREGEV